MVLNKMLTKERNFVGVTLEDMKNDLFTYS